MDIIKIVADIVGAWLKAKKNGEAFSILEAMGVKKSLSRLTLEARLGDENAQRLLKEYWEIRGKINKQSRNKLSLSCALWEWKLLTRWTPLDYNRALSKIGVSSENYIHFIAPTDPNWLNRGKTDLDLDDVSDECFISYLNYIHPF